MREILKLLKFFFYVLGITIICGRGPWVVTVRRARERFHEVLQTSANATVLKQSKFLDEKVRGQRGC